MNEDQDNKIYDSSQVTAMLEERKKKWKEEYDRMPKHTFKKGQHLWEVSAKYGLTSMVKVVDCAPHILLVKNVEYGGKSIAYRAEPKHFGNYTLISAKELYTLRLKGIVGKIVSALQDVSFWVCKKSNLGHTRNPESLRDYTGNWLAFIHTFFARVHCYLWDPSATYENTFKDVDAHGPLWKKRS